MLRKQYICFLKQKMRVKLATQLLNKSVGDALKFCKVVCKLKVLLDATLNFIAIFNTIFDI